jgi:murein L,D-transpeptidase YafK
MAGPSPRHSLRIVLIAAIIAACVPCLSVARTASAALLEGSTESLLSQAINEIQRQRFDAALERIDSLIRIRPNFRLAHLIRGDLLLARARPLNHIGDTPQASQNRIEDFREEAIARLRAYRDQPDPSLIPKYLLKLRPEQQYAVVVDTTRSRLYLYQNDSGRPKFLADYYISSGKQGAQKAREGDMKTPIGVYHVTASLPVKKLPDFYGSGAFPINYPNDWDRRMGRDGHGIWLHGTPTDTYSRPPRASDGCVVLSNSDLNLLSKYLQIGLTPVIISSDVEWVSTGEWATERDEFLAQVETWRSDWESRNTDKFLSHYSRKFSSGTQSFENFAKQKRQVNAGKAWVKVDIADISAFRSPGRDELVEVTFSQTYRSNNSSNTMKKRQYWQREADGWRIVFEGAA